MKAGRENAIDQRWMRELENANIRVRMSRLESLQSNEAAYRIAFSKASNWSI